MQAFPAFNTKKTFLSALLSLLCSLTLVGNILAYSYPPEVTGITTGYDAETLEAWITWQPITSEQYSDDVITNYRIYYGTKPVVTVDDYYDNDVSVPATESMYTFTDLEAGTYYFAVTAINSSGDESVTYSAEVSMTIEAKKLEPIPEPVTPEPTIDERIEETPVTTETPVNTRIEVAPAPEPVIIDEPNTVQAAEPTIPKAIDTTPPLNPSNLLVNTNRVAAEKKVILNWNKAIDIYEDIQDQVLYTRKGLGQWDSGYSIGADLESIEIDIEHNQNYEIKIVTVDQSGNESDGVSYIFSTHLAESGPDSWWSILIAMLVFVGLLWTAMQTKR